MKLAIFSQPVMKLAISSQPLMKLAIFIWYTAWCNCTPKSAFSLLHISVKCFTALQIPNGQIQNDSHTAQRSTSVSTNFTMLLNYRTWQDVPEYRTLPYTQTCQAPLLTFHILYKQKCRIYNFCISTRSLFSSMIHYLQFVCQYPATTRVWPKVSGLAAWSENCK
jgi:hypothetical protein